MVLEMIAKRCGIDSQEMFVQPAKVSADRRLADHCTRHRPFRHDALHQSGERMLAYSPHTAHTHHQILFARPALRVVRAART